MLKKLLIILFFILGFIFIYTLLNSSTHTSKSQPNSVPILQKQNSITTSPQVIDKPSSPITPFQHNLKHAVALNHEYQLSDDLHGLYLKYKESKNPDELYIAEQAISFCKQFISSPSDEALTLSPKSMYNPLPNHTPDQNTAIQHLYSICSTFSHEFKTAKQYFAEEERLSERVVSGESYSSAVDRMILLASQGERDKIIPLLKEVILSKEPDAINSVQDIILKRWQGAESKGVVGQFAIRLAACDLGRECSKDALDQQLSCLSGSACNLSLEDELMNHLTPTEQQEVMQKKALFLRAVDEGDLAALGIEDKKVK
ncbi:hypothetical protein [Aquirhabdus sp.]|uniref:hypothetical protein n=1 Tax=Aquirhabdus sp. TaxID=2824160 RepID=UPI00396C672D